MCTSERCGRGGTVKAEIIYYPWLLNISGYLISLVITISGYYYLWLLQFLVITISGYGGNTET